MSVPIQRVLQTKGSDVLTITSDASVGEAVRRLADRNVGAIVVVEGETAVGVLSERDVVRQLAVHPDVLELTVGEVMTSPVHSCGPDATIDELMHLMTEGRFRHVPVIDDGRLVGIVSIGDVVKHRIDELATQAEQLTDYVSGSY
ncbi:CBS domain-containing protein [Nitriliruptor alkaliphilus]|uniref:CBS domain-containing protein n=1 Tax=Nitriliruptor alkaliphilus TaxID=427918 RepID=UPI000A74C257|nr:CBS domain-containing protein [Nitriliruptor alkaliphilus]